jgi:hypothetical protein
MAIENGTKPPNGVIDFPKNPSIMEGKAMPLSAMFRFKVYLKERLNYLASLQTGNEEQDSEADMAYVELMHIFDEILPELEKEKKENESVRDFYHKR